MTKPDWKDAPEWAQWLARDSNGLWYWYEMEPYVVDDLETWDNQAGLFLQALPVKVSGWETTLEQRPAVQP